MMKHFSLKLIQGGLFKKAIILPVRLENDSNYFLLHSDCDSRDIIEVLCTPRAAPCKSAQHLFPFPNLSSQGSSKSCSHKNCCLDLCYY